MSSHCRESVQVFSTPFLGSCSKYLYKMTPTIVAIDIKNIHQIYLDTKMEYPKYNERFQYFLVACHYIDLDLAIKLRPHGGLFGIDNSRMDKYLNHNKVFRLRAILYDATGSKLISGFTQLPDVS